MAVQDGSAAQSGRGAKGEGRARRAQSPARSDCGSVGWVFFVTVKKSQIQFPLNEFERKSAPVASRLSLKLICVNAGKAGV